MHTFIALFAITILGSLLGASPTQAEVTYPWCAQYGMQGTSNCGFSTAGQCQAALSGNGGYCELNPAYRPGAEHPLVARRARR